MSKRAWGSAQCAAVICTAELAYAGAWNPPKGDGQIILTSLWSGGKSNFDAKGNQQPITDFSKTESRLFLEHGLADRWALTGNAAFQTLSYNGPQNQFTFNDFDQTELGLRYQIARREGFAVSAQLSYILDGGPADNILDIGGDRDLAELRGLWGQSFETERYGDVFFDAQIAARLETGGRYHSTHGDLTVGWKPHDKWLIMLQSYNAFIEPESALGFTVEAKQRLKLNPSVTYQYSKRQSVQLGYITTWHGRGIVKEEGLSLGFWWRY